jgi:hypothetical protein
VLYRDITPYKYQLAEPMAFMTGITGYSFDAEFIEMTPEGQLTILTGYMWDGASGPTIDSECSMRASLLHDALFQLIRLNLLPLKIKPIADKLFHDILIHDGMAPIRAMFWYEAIQHFSASSCVPGSEPLDKILTAGEE